MTGNLLYCLLVPTKQASWDPRNQDQEGEGEEEREAEKRWRHQYCDTRSLTSIGTQTHHFSLTFLQLTSQKLPNRDLVFSVTVQYFWLEF
jgi:hypothetical protein